MADTAATNARTVTIDLPDYGGETVRLRMARHDHPLDCGLTGGRE